MSFLLPLAVLILAVLAFYSNHRVYALGVRVESLERSRARLEKAAEEAEGILRRIMEREGRRP